LSGDAGLDAGVAVTPNAGGLPISNACLHVRIEDGAFYVVEGIESPSDRFEPVLNFVKSEEGFELRALFPWEISYPYFDAVPRFLPEDELIEIVASRNKAAIEVGFELRSDRVFIRSIVVVEFEP
jgi:hypothetical protein